MRQNGNWKNSGNIKRTNLRPQVLSGKSKNTGRPFDDAWLKEKWPELLDAHYQCLVPGQSACLQDALRMITTGKVFITCLGAKKEKEQEPRTLSQLEVQVIKEWYDAKDQKLVEKRGELYVTERNLSSAARAYHEENKEDHARTRGAVEKAAKDVLDAQVAIHATVEDIASSLGVRMGKKRKKTFVRAIRARHVSS